MPPSVTGELLRLRLVDQLTSRWDVAVTTVVAGAGLGKSTALAQAVRHNHARPRGVDAWVSCEPGDEHADRLAAAIVAAVGVPFAGVDAASAVTNALRSTSPLAVCLVIDDLHELPAQCSSVELLDTVVRTLPADAHLVLAGRTLPPLPLTRLRAAERVLDVTEDDLTFTPDELGAVATSAGGDPDRLTALGGWPALVRLALGAPGQPTGECAQFVWEEVVSRLEAGDLRALLALATMGTADAPTLATLCGGPVDLDRLARTVPMVAHTGDGRLRAHDLWHGTLSRLMCGTEVSEVGRAAAEHLLAAGSFVRAGSLAARLGHIDTVCAASLALVRNTMSAVPVDTAAAWLRAVPAGDRDRPELLLLDAVARHATGDRDADIDALVARATDVFRQRGDDLAEQTALGFRLLLAHTRADTAAALGLVEEAAHLPGLERDPTLRVLGPMVESIGAHLVGDVERGADVLDRLSIVGLPPVIAEVVLRWRWHLLTFAGRASDAAHLPARILAEAATPNAPLFGPVARWLGGDPSGFDDLVPTGLDDHAVRDWQGGRDWFNYGVFTALVWSSFGDRDVVGRAVRLLRSLDLDTGTSRNGGPIAVAEAAAAVLDHDDEQAAAIIDAFVTRFPIADPFTDITVRRFLGIPYVCSPAIRACWDERPLGPAHRSQRDVARALLAARAGTLTADGALPAPPAVFTALPLPWSVELAVRAEGAQHKGGRALAQWLVDRVGSAAHAELRRRAGDPDVHPDLAPAAQRLLAVITLPPSATTRVEVLGPVRMLSGGEVVVRPEQRRARVRELLAVLTIHPTIGRDRAMDLLWPDLAPNDAARNLRVTLTHLRRWLEPERERGEQGYHLRADADRVWLVPSARLSVDVWELHHHLRAASAARTAGDAVEQAAHLERVVELWRGDPLADLERVPELSAEAQHLRLRLVDSTLTLGELRLAEGDGLATLACAEKALAADPYDERAFRLLIAAHLLRGDRAGTLDAAHRTLAALDDLGVDPDARTTILLRQAGIGALATR